MKFKSLYINGRPLKSLSINGRKVWGKQQADNKPYLKFTAEADGSSVSMAKNGTAPELSLVYSTNGGNTWQDFIVGQTTVNLDSGDSMYLKASKDNEIVNQGTGTSTSNYNKFSIGGLVKASGNIMTLLRGDGELDQIPSTYCFSSLFYGCTSLTQAPELPSTTLTSSCYQQMFAGCTSLTQAPKLPATTLYNRCYYTMFSRCTSLAQAPELPATTLYDSCYDTMFSGCTSLAQAPKLPATTLSSFCYSSMFYGCTALTQAPELPATTLTSSCYQQMFKGCTSLTQAPELPATTLFSNCYLSMFSDCTSLNDISVRFSDWKTYTGGTNGWMYNIRTTGTFNCPQALIDATTTRGGNTVPDGWNMVSND